MAKKKAKKKTAKKADPKRTLSDALGDAGDKLEGAAAQTLDAAKEAAAKAAGKAVKRLIGNGIPDDVDPVESVLEAEDLGDALDAGLTNMVEAFSSQLVGAVDNLVAVGVESTAATTKILDAMADLASKSAAGEISPETAENATNNYLHALTLVKEALANEASTQAFLRGKALLENSKRVGFSLLKYGIGSASPIAGAVVSGFEAAAEAAKA